ncbi:DUF4097 family beta strand repeat-containing protein [Cesiribacter sp. SM1]|uniref:DUF4097 family beta strand repeat-containing protein n=1 Tax=Cesiribacter sp. SM1 TaxID=2861196 RepID=UPI001CD6B938|nr:DUF4097 family beta strand repeat-containing protein [Cesiribacter sp. SM1]
MKTRTICNMLLALLFLYLPAAAQQDSDQIAIPLSEPGKAGKLSVQSLNGGIRVEGYNGKEVVVRYTSGGNRRNNSKPEMANGMRRVSDNNMGLDIKEERNEVDVKVNSWMSKADLTILVPRNFSLHLRTVNDGLIEVKDVQGELDISNVNGSVLLHNISGAAVVNTVNGEIEAFFADTPPNAPMSFTNINGQIQIKLPADAKFNVKARSQFGDVYTNYDMKMKQEEVRAESTSSGGTYRVKIDNWVQGEVNGGGPEIYVKSLNGTIYIQKK